METFLHRRPYVNPPYQQDNFARDKHVFERLE
jgi:hypothetical protein